MITRGSPLAGKNSCRYMAFELTKPSNCYVKRVIGPLILVVKHEEKKDEI